MEYFTDSSTHKGIINLALTEGGLAAMKRCPFCRQKKSIELCNTHTQTYWIECECGCELHDTAPQENNTRAGHLRSANRVMEKWNAR